MSSGTICLICGVITAFMTLTDYFFQKKYGELEESSTLLAALFYYFIELAVIGIGIFSFFKGILT